MKVLSFWDPWGTLVALGYKKWETRSKPTYYRGPLAIHVAKNQTALDDVGLKLVEAGIKKSLFDPDPFPTGFNDWPLGKIIAVCDVTDCRRTEDVTPCPQERALGDYSPKRFVWTLANVRRVKPLAFRGSQGIKNLPKEVEDSLEFVEAV